MQTAELRDLLSKVSDVFSTSHTAVAFGIRGLRSLMAALLGAFAAGAKAKRPKYGMGNRALYRDP